MHVIVRDHGHHASLVLDPAILLHRCNVHYKHATIILALNLCVIENEMLFLLAVPQKNCETK